jgi:hypothetical protein
MSIAIVYVCELRRGAGLVKSCQTHFFLAFCNKLDGTAINVIDEGEITMAFAERILIDVDARDGGGLFAGQPAGNGSVEGGPGLIPAYADERAGSLHGLTGLEDVDHEPLHEQRKASVGLCPRHLDL